MHLLEQYVENFNSKDSKKFASTFTEDCVFNDTAPTKVGMDPMWLLGRECVDMMFNMYFNVMPISAKLVKLNDDSSMDYIISYPGFDMPCRGTILEEKDGKIARYSVAFRGE